MVVLYEVNLELQKEIEQAYLAWLAPHMKEMGNLIKGVLSAKLYRRRAEDEGREADPAVSLFTVVYRIQTRAALDDYLQHRAAAMREDGMKRFGGQFKASRRILQEVDEEGDEIVGFNEAHYTKGLNTQFLVSGKDALKERFANDDGIFEGRENRAIAAHFDVFEKAMLAQCPIAGTTVCDVGCGTGLLTFFLAKHASHVYGTEISRGFIDLCEERAKERGVTNCTFVQSGDKNLGAVPDASVDFVLICDVYHHFLFPALMLRDVLRVLKPGGRVLLVDFHRDPSRMHAIEGWMKDDPNWVLEHVRADKDEFVAEFEANGFAVEKEFEVEAIRENYSLQFVRKPL